MKDINKDNKYFNISFSKYKTFENCPIKYTLEYLLNQRETLMTFAIANGFLTHLFIEKYIKNEIPSHIYIINEYYDNINQKIKEDNLIKLLTEKIEDTLNSNNNFIDLLISELNKTPSLFFTIIKNVKNTIPFIDFINKNVINSNFKLKSETKFNTIILNDKVNLNTIIDLYFIDKNNNLYVVDFKTTNKEKYDYKQNLLYAYAILHNKDSEIVNNNIVPNKVVLGFYNPKYYSENTDNNIKFSNFKKIKLDVVNVNHFFENIFISGLNILLKYTEAFNNNFKNLIDKINNEYYKLTDTDYKMIFEFINDYFKNDELLFKKEVLTLLLINDKEFKPYINNDLNLCYFCNFKNICFNYLLNIKLLG